MLIRWTLLLRRLALLIGCYTILRGLFLICNYRIFKAAPANQLALAFVYGLRFDLSAILAINAPFIVFTFLPRVLDPPPGYRRFVKWLFLGLNLPFLALNILDLEYFQFTGRRSTLALLFMAGDAGLKLSSLIAYYWPLLLLAVALFSALYFLYGRVPSRASIPGSDRLTLDQSNQAPTRFSSFIPVWLWLLNLLIIFALGIIGFRGGLQYRPISLAQAMPEGAGPLPQLVLNSSFTVIKSYHKAELTRLQYFDEESELVKYLRPFQAVAKSIPDEPRRDNVVIFILESFSAEYWGVGNGGARYTPFLDSLASHSLFFSHNYANGRRSIEAAPSILAGLPSLMSESLLESVYQNNQLIGLGTLLAPCGYTSSFFHGAANGTMRFDTLCRRAGMQNYFGLNEYPSKKADFDGHWGIFDEPYFQYVARELTLQKPPFVATIFSLSSHHPYAVPEKYRGRFKKGTLAIHESIGYTDFALEQFFATAQKQPWYSNTLFVITGDHTSKLETPEYLNPLGQYRVPLLFFHPQVNLTGGNTNRVTQHVDILPSILDYLQIDPPKRLPFGVSVFRYCEGRAFLRLNGHYWLVRGAHALEFAPEGQSRFFDLVKDATLQSPQAADSEDARAMEKEAKALVQYFNNGMIANRLYETSPMGRSDPKLNAGR